MEAELIALDNNHTWEIVDLPPDKKPIGCKWVYRIKQCCKRRSEARLKAPPHQKITLRLTPQNEFLMRGIRLNSERLEAVEAQRLIQLIKFLF